MVVMMMTVILLLKSDQLSQFAWDGLWGEPRTFSFKIERVLGIRGWVGHPTITITTATITTIITEASSVLCYVQFKLSHFYAKVTESYFRKKKIFLSVTYNPKKKNCACHPNIFHLEVGPNEAPLI